MKKLKTRAMSITSALFLILGIVMLFTNHFVSIMFFIASLMLNPNFEALSKKIRSYIFFTTIILALLSLFWEASNTKIKKTKQEIRAEYAVQNKEKILGDIKDKLSRKEYFPAVDVAKKYKDVDDEFNGVYEAAFKAKMAFIRENRAKEMLLKLEELKEDDYYNGNRIYNILSVQYPDNKDFLEKAKFYSKKYAEQQAIAAKNKQKRAEIKSQFSAWDGSHINLEKEILRGTNDPDSYKHVETSYIDFGDYLIVTTKFRAKNKFGAMVVTFITAKVDFDGNILEIISVQ